MQHRRAESFASHRRHDEVEKKNKIYRLNNSYRIFFMKLQRPGESERDVGLVYEAREFRHQRSVRRATQKLASLHILREDERHL